MGEGDTALITRLGNALKPYLDPNNVAKQLRTYLSPGMYTGATFDLLPDRRQPSHFTEADFAAVSMLSVEVPAPVRKWLLTEGALEVGQLLRGIPDTAHISSRENYLARGTATWELWHLLRTAKGMGGTTTSKLMAAKRPHLVPIHDSVVSEALGLPLRNSWAEWRQFMTVDWWPHLATEIRRVADASEAEHLSDLRVIDIVVWMTEIEKRRAVTPRRNKVNRKPLVPTPQAVDRDDQWDRESKPPMDHTYPFGVGPRVRSPYRTIRIGPRRGS